MINPYWYTKSLQVRKCWQKQRQQLNWTVYKGGTVYLSSTRDCRWLFAVLKHIFYNALNAARYSWWSSITALLDNLKSQILVIESATHYALLTIKLLLIRKPWRSCGSCHFLYWKKQTALCLFVVSVRCATHQNAYAHTLDTQQMNWQRQNEIFQQGKRSGNRAFCLFFHPSGGVYQSFRTSSLVENRFHIWFAFLCLKIDWFSGFVRLMYSLNSLMGHFTSLWSSLLAPIPFLWRKSLETLRRSKFFITQFICCCVNSYSLLADFCQEAVFNTENREERHNLFFWWQLGIQISKIELLLKECFEKLGNRFSFCAVARLALLTPSESDLANSKHD